MRSFSIAACFCALSLPSFAASPQLARIFSDHMVLQREMAAPVWGWDDPGGDVTVEFSGQTLSTKADRDGRWSVRLAPLKCPPSNAPQSLVVKGKGGITTVKDILVGDVWICAGQSNMAFKLNRATNGSQAAAAANDSLLRICDVSGKRSKEGDPAPDDLETASWKPASPSSVPDFSAVGYFFGRDLREYIGVPVGLIDTSVGGTPMKSWMSREVMESDPDLRADVQRSDSDMSNHPKLQQQYERRLASYQEKAASGKATANKPIAPKGPDSSYRLSYFHTSVIRKLQPMAIKGVIWYQGEANAGRYAVFQHQFSTLVKEWREEWEQGDFPWLYVQLAPYSDANGRLFPRVWEAQSKAQAIPNSAMVVSLDQGVANNIHPPSKEPIGKRLALAARGLAYQQKEDWRGPTFARAETRGAAMGLHFESVGKGLLAKEPGYFTIAGEDRNFVTANAKLNADNTITVSSPDVPHPVAARYGWYELGGPVGASLFGKNGLPVAPFRTDDWPDQR